MPIRFTGSARPNRVKSPTPAAMPSVRENIATRQRTEVDYFNANGALPSVAPPVPEWDDYWTVWLDHSPATNKPRFGQPIEISDNGLYMIITAEGSQLSSTSQPHFFRRDNTTDPWTYVGQYFSRGNRFGRGVFIDDVNNDIYFGHDANADQEGRVRRVAFDPVTFIPTENEDQNVYQFTTQNGARLGRSVTKIGSTIFATAHGYDNPNTDEGALVFIDETTFANKQLLIDGTRMDHRIEGSDVVDLNTRLKFFHIDSEDDRIIAMHRGSGTNSSQPESFMSVHRYNEGAGTFDLIQVIDHPAQGSSSRGFWNDGMGVVDGCIFAALGYDTNLVADNESVIVYEWNGSQYVQKEWFDLVNRPNDTTRLKMKPISKDQILLASGDNSTGRIYSLTRNP